MAVPVREEPSVLATSTETDLSGIPETVQPTPRIEPLAAKHVPALDGVRGLAIALVLVAHAVRGAVASAGWVGVDLFFVLSGFLITGILWDSREKPHRVRTFYVRRALRILPLYYAVVLGLFVAIPLLHPLQTDQYREISGEQWWYWLYLQNWVVALKHRADGGPLGWFWSLAIEEQFYLFWPLLIWRASQRVIVRVCIAVLASGLLIRTMVLLMYPEHRTDLFVYVLTPCRLDGLVVGSLVAIKIREPGGYAALYRLIRLPAIASAIFLSAVAILDLHAGRWALSYTPIVQTLGYPALAVAFGGLLVASLGPWRWLMSTRLLRWLGVYSYGIYVLHPFVLSAFRHGTSLVLGTWQYAVAGTVSSLVVAWLSYHLYERHWLALKNRLT